MDNRSNVYCIFWGIKRDQIVNLINAFWSCITGWACVVSLPLQSGRETSPVGVGGARESDGGFHRCYPKFTWSTVVPLSSANWHSSWCIQLTNCAFASRNLFYVTLELLFDARILLAWTHFIWNWVKRVGVGGGVVPVEFPTLNLSHCSNKIYTTVVLHIVIQFNTLRNI